MSNDKQPTLPPMDGKRQFSKEQMLLISAKDALRSYQFGNSSPDVAELIANTIEKHFKETR